MEILRFTVYLLAVGLASAVPSPLAAQSPETCVAYMEADAAFDPAWRAFQTTLAAVEEATAAKN